MIQKEVSEVFIVDVNYAVLIVSIRSVFPGTSEGFIAGLNSIPVVSLCGS